MPAGTGVCVVNTVRARTICSACSGSTPLLDEAAHALDAEEARVALVHVEHGGLDAAGRERLDAADAEQDLLPQAVLAVAAVEAVGDRALGRGVGGHVGVEQQQRARGRRRRARGRRAAWRPAAARTICSGSPSSARTGVIGSSAGSSSTNSSCWAPRGGEQLPEVAVAVEEADADDRDAEVAGGLEVVAGQDAEPARVLRQRLAEAELGREVGDRAGRLRQRAVPARRRPGARSGARRPRQPLAEARHRRPAPASRAGAAAASIATGLPEAAASPSGSTSREHGRDLRIPASRRGCAPAARAARGRRAAAARSGNGQMAGSCRVSPRVSDAGRQGKPLAEHRSARREPPGTASVQVIAGHGLPGGEGSVA